MNRLPRRRTARGFTLVEVLVALLVTATGLLGLAKMQALAISTTKESGTRSLVALQTGSLVSAMHANSAFWGTGAAPASFTIKGTTVTDASNKLAGGAAGGCRSASCTPVSLAAVDVMNWAVDMDGQFPNFTGKVDCTTALPIGCSVYVTWTEKTVAVGKSTETGAGASTQSFSVYVKP